MFDLDSDSTPRWVWYLVLVYLSLPLLFYVLLPKLYGNVSSRRRIVVFVLGDLGHSPRMCYHARSFAAKGWQVDLCGYIEEQPPLDLIDNDYVGIHSVPELKNTQDLPFVVFGILKVFYQLYTLLSMLWSLRGANYILIQNPPSIPLLAVAVLFRVLSRARLIIDWHNLNFSILAIKLGDKHPFVTISKLYEHLFGKFANVNLTVTEAMKTFLVDEFGLSSEKIVVLYDKAASQFKPLSDEKRGDVIESHAQLFEGFNIKKDKLLLSSTSFTPDEDFRVLVNALVHYDNTPNVPHLTVIITGKGPLKDEFLSAVQKAQLANVNVKTAWLSAEEYPLVLATADLGVSLHTSSSGIDLPMKVVDMFGCGVPVVALDFPALGELVDGANGVRVRDAEEMAHAFTDLFTNRERYESLKHGAVIKSRERWETNWKHVFGDQLI